MSQNVASNIETMITPIVESHQMEVVDVQYVKEGKEWYLRIFIDKLEGILLDDCELISRKIGELLDETDPIKTNYILEVSSPGIERPLKKEKDYNRFIDRKIRLKTFEPIYQTKNFEGILKGCKNSIVTVEVNGQHLEFPMDKIASAYLTVEF